MSRVEDEAGEAITRIFKAATKGDRLIASIPVEGEPPISVSENTESKLLTIRQRIGANPPQSIIVDDGVSKALVKVLNLWKP